MQEYVVDVTGANSWSDFISAFNEGFVRQFQTEWNGNLDAFNDYLYWPDEHPYRLVLKGWSACMPQVNQHRAPDGQPILEVIKEIFRNNPQVDVIFD